MTGATAFRASFDCLWCGTPHATRGPDDLEGWAQLCPACLGRAGENPFLRFRLRTAIADRAAAGRTGDTAAAAAVVADESPVTEPETGSDPMVAYYEARAPEYDEWYLRRGRYARGAIHDMAWQADLDTATAWLDALPLSGRIVELAAGTGWWSPLLATKGELWCTDAASAPLDILRHQPVHVLPAMGADDTVILEQHGIVVLRIHQRQTAFQTGIQIVKCVARRLRLWNQIDVHAVAERQHHDPDEVPVAVLEFGKDRVPASRFVAHSSTPSFFHRSKF